MDEPVLVDPTEVVKAVVRVRVVDVDVAHKRIGLYFPACLTDRPDPIDNRVVGGWSGSCAET